MDALRLQNTATCEALFVVTGCGNVCRYTERTWTVQRLTYHYKFSSVKQTILVRILEVSDVGNHLHLYSASQQ